MNLHNPITQRYLRRVGFCIGTLGIVGVGYVLSHANPSGRWQAFFPKCIFFLTTGLQCPGCGCTRALYHLLNGRLLLALQYNAMLVITLPWLLLESIRASCWFLEIPLSQSLRRRVRLRGWQALLIGFAVMAFWILRNVPFMPFEWLAPPKSMIP